MNELAVGTRVYNHGDMANSEHSGTIIEMLDDRWGLRYRIRPDEDSGYEHGPYWIPALIFSDTYEGNGLTRFVLESEYQRWVDERRSSFMRQFSKEAR